MKRSSRSYLFTEGNRGNGVFNYLCYFHYLLFSSLDSRHFFLLHPHEVHVEALLLDRLKINPPELIVLPIIGQCVRAAGVIRCAELDEDI